MDGQRGRISTASLHQMVSTECQLTASIGHIGDLAGPYPESIVPLKMEATQTRPQDSVRAGVPDLD